MKEEQDIRKDYEVLDDAIRDMLDIACGWCRPMSAEEKIEVIKRIGEGAVERAGAQRYR